MTPRRVLRSLGHPAVPFIAGFLILWDLGVRVLGVSAHLLPPPTQVLAGVVTRLPFYMEHAAFTMQSIGAGLVVAFVLSCVLAVIIAESPLLGQALYPFLIASQAVPAIAVAPMLMVYFGFGVLPKAIVVTLICFFPLTINISRGLSEFDADAMTLMKSLGAGRVSTLVRFRVPCALPYIFAGLRISVVLAVVGAVVAEFVGSLRGLGFVILLASEQFNAELTFAAITVTCALGLALYGTVLVLQWRVMPWK